MALRNSGGFNRCGVGFALLSIWLPASEANWSVFSGNCWFSCGAKWNVFPEPGASAGGPAIFATLSFPNATGFVTIIHPTSGTTEFVLQPNSLGELTVSYTSTNNLTALFFTDPVPVLDVLPNGTLGTGSGLSVTQLSLTLVSTHQVVVNYAVTSGGSDGLYVLGLPSTFLSTIVDVGTQPYTGPLTWLDGIIN